MSPAELWALPYDEFNTYRREQDLPKLFNFFQKTLPKFDQWLSENDLSIDFILSTDNPGQFLYWNRPLYIIHYPHEGETKAMFVDIESKLHETRLIENLKKRPDQTAKRILPYTGWINEEIKKDKELAEKYKRGFNNLRYTLRTAPDVPEMCSASFSGGFTVLKLGGLKIESWAKLYGRNLDFTNLDHLQIEGDWSNNSEINIFYASMENITLTNVQANFTKFFHCEFRNLKARDTTFHWIEFSGCDVFGFNLKDCWVSTIILDRCSVSSLSFDKVEVETIHYIVPESEHFQGRIGTFESASENFKKLRLLYQSNGLRSLASESYYRERFYEMRHLWASSRMKEVFSSLRRGKWDFAFAYFKIHGKNLANSIIDFVSYIIWGFGEKPYRVFLTSLAFIIFFAMLYFSSGIQSLDGNAVESIYLSTILFSTLGFGDYAPYQVGAFKLVLAFESLIGAFMLGLFVAGYANKGRY